LIRKPNKLTNKTWIQKGDENQKYIHDRLTETYNWYQNADNKAQIILGFASIFLSVVLASLFSSIDKIDSIRSIFQNWYNFGLIVVVFLSYVIAIGICVFALWSRNIFRAKKKGVGFFSNIANYPDPIIFKKALEEEFKRNKHQKLQTRSLYYLSISTKSKHKLVNIAAFFSGVALFSTVLLAILILAKI
jgi:hypothetical protein